MTLVCSKVSAFLKHVPWFNESYLQIGFIESGNIEIGITGSPKNSLSKGSWFLVKPASSIFEFRVLKNSRVHWIEFDETSSQSLSGFSNTLIERIKNPKIPYFESDRASGQLLKLGSEISNIKGDSTRERLLAEAKTLEWLAILLDHPVFSPCKIAVPQTLNREEVALNAAKLILETRLEETHTLSNISREIHLNEFKLKKGFREKFNTTVFGYLRQKRMERAHQILSEGKLSVIEVANEVGYSNASHFARAFKEAFGFNPSNIAR